MRTFTSLILLIFLISGCELNFKSGNGNMEEKQTDVESFSEVHIGGNFDVALIPSDKNSVLVSADENLMKYINVEVHNNSLNINTVHNLKSSRGIKITINYTSLTGIYSTGASRITHNNALQSKDLQIDLSGTGSIELGVDVETATVTMTGAGLVKLNGKASLLSAVISGAGGLVASDLIAQNCDISLSGLGGASVYVTDKLDANISGIGGIQYAGNPEHIEKSITGLGKITQADNDN
ncbi:MAG: head GIN domain-containing protein [Cyclobacteriaceae bacterium]|nr:head GIN domain-containing protein [Cyclobacteriaceae bacterium]